MIFRTERMAELFCCLINHGLEPKRMRMIEPYAGRPPKLFLLESVCGGKTGLKVENPLVIYKEDGEYTDEVKAIYHIES